MGDLKIDGPLYNHYVSSITTMLVLYNHYAIGQSTT